MIARSTLYSNPGGDTTQMVMTAKHLENLGINAEIKLSNDNIDFSSVDLVHFFNIFRPDDILPHLLKLKQPFVVSTIFVDYAEFDKRNRKGLAGLLSKLFDRNQMEFLKTIARSFKNGEKIKSSLYMTMGQKRSVKYIAKQASVLLPNSHNEYKRLNKVYGIEQRYIKVVNAIDTTLFNNKVVPNPSFSGHVICVGRIEGLKNQLNLIKALSTTDLPLTIIGKPSANHISYYKESVHFAKEFGNIHFIDYVDHEKLPEIYKAAKVHVLPSWFETTGLSSLEAAAMGCNVVVTKKGDTEEYFKDMVYYCDPGDVNSIRKAVFEAYNNPVNTKLQEYVLNNYTWNDTAKQTANAYKTVLNIKI